MQAAAKFIPLATVIVISFWKKNLLHISFVFVHRYTNFNIVAIKGLLYHYDHVELLYY